MKHPNALVLEKIYAAFTQNDSAALLALCAEDITFQIAGKSGLAGKYNKQNFSLLKKQKDLSNGSFRLEAHDIMASDQHAVALVSEFVTRNGETVQMRMAHVWRFQNEKPVAFYSYARDLYQFDQIWS